MSAPQFTPGPWHADKINAWGVWASDCKVAKTFDVNQASQYREPSEDERIANARLIAAAPELYGLAERAMRWFADNGCAGELAWEIGETLAKARGEAA